MIPPCERDCPSRSPSCHTVCEKYLVYRAEREKLYADRAKNFDIEGYLSKVSNSKNKKLRRRS